MASSAVSASSVCGEARRLSGTPRVAASAVVSGADLAKDYSQESLLSALEELVRMGQVQLVTPALVIEEFKRNRDRVVEDAGRSIGSTMRRAKELLANSATPPSKPNII